MIFSGEAFGLADAVKESLMTAHSLEIVQRVRWYTRKPVSLLIRLVSSIVAAGTGGGTINEFFGEPAASIAALVALVGTSLTFWLLWPNY